MYRIQFSYHGRKNEVYTCVALVFVLQAERLKSLTNGKLAKRLVGKTTVHLEQCPYPQESEGKIKQDLSVFHKIKGSNLFEGACHNKIYCKIH